VEYKHRDGSVPEVSHINTFLASFTTSLGRIKLYRQLARLQRNVLYYDTDSIQYIYNENDPQAVHPPLGPYLGMWTNELPPGSYITEFVSSGPKSYGYVTDSTSIVTKLKGFTVTHSVSQSVNFDNIKALVLHFVDPEKYPLPNELKGVAALEAYYPGKIHRNRYQIKLYGKNVRKTFRVTFGKRQMEGQGSFNTLPFGYRT
jgi:hypothetical protein